MSRFAVLIEHRLGVVKVGPPGVPGLNEELDVDLGPHELNWMSPKCRSGARQNAHTEPRVWTGGPGANDTGDR